MPVLTDRNKTVKNIVAEYYIHNYITYKEIVYTSDPTALIASTLI